MRVRLLLATGLLVLVGCGKEVEPVADRPEAPQAAANAPTTPDIARCDAEHERTEFDPIPSDPVEVPAAFRNVVASSALEMAILTKTGSTFCHNNVGIYGVHNMAWLAEDRLLGWEWDAYEAFGYAVVDRQGVGTVIETGVKPTFSPSGQRFASVQVSEASFGGLEGFAVWGSRDNGLIQLGGDLPDKDFVSAPVFQSADIMIGGDWQVSGWSGEGCVGLSVAPWDNTAQNYDRTKAIAYHAAEANGWHVKPGTCP